MCVCSLSVTGQSWMWNYIKTEEIPLPSIYFFARTWSLNSWRPADCSFSLYHHWWNRWLPNQPKSTLSYGGWTCTAAVKPGQYIGWSGGWNQNHPYQRKAKQGLTIKWQKRLWKTVRKVVISDCLFKEIILMDLLRFITAGSVDDGKSTLIGRFCTTAKVSINDQLEAVERSTKNKANGEIDPQLINWWFTCRTWTRYYHWCGLSLFSTPKRKFIIADAPGHVQYTRNMITGASNASLIIVLIDARQGWWSKQDGIPSLLHIEDSTCGGGH